MRQTHQETDIEGLGKILRVNTPFDMALEALKRKGAKVITSRDFAYARRCTYINSLKDGGCTREGVIYGKNQAPLVVMNSPLLNQKLAVRATQANREGEYFQLKDKKRFESYLRQADADAKKEPEKRKVLTLPSRTSFTISPIENWDIARGIFKDQAEPYFNYLGKHRINQITFYTVDSLDVDNSENPIATQMWLHRFEFSVLGGDYKDLDRANRVVRGIKVDTEGTPKNVESYTPIQISRTLDILGISGLEQNIIEKLRDIRKLTS